MTSLRSLLLLSLVLSLSACGGSDDADASEAEVRLAEANARIAEAEARAAEAEAQRAMADEADLEVTTVEEESPESESSGTASTSTPQATPAATSGSSTRPGLTGLPPAPNAPDFVDGTQRFRFCPTYRRSAIARYEGLELCYVGTLRQEGATLVGSGEKDTENGQTLRGAARTPFRIEGRIYEDYTVRFNFTDRGTRRVSRGSADFPESGLNGGCEGSVWEDGSFQTDAANSSGTASLFIQQQCDV